MIRNSGTWKKNSEAYKKKKKNNLRYSETFNKEDSYLSKTAVRSIITIIQYRYLNLDKKNQYKRIKYRDPN